MDGLDFQDLVKQAMGCTRRDFKMTRGSLRVLKDGCSVFWHRLLEESCCLAKMETQGHRARKPSRERYEQAAEWPNYSALVQEFSLYDDFEHTRCSKSSTGCGVRMSVIMRDVTHLYALI